MKALIPVIAVGAAIGLLVPGSRPEAPPAPPAQPGAPPPEVRLEREGNGHFYVHGQVNGQLARFVVDTGASFVALTMEDAERLGIPFDKSQFRIVGTGASGPVSGQTVTLDRIVVEGREVRDVNGAVLDGLQISLLGQSFLSRIGTVEMSGDYMVLR